MICNKNNIYPQPFFHSLQHLHNLSNPTLKLTPLKLPIIKLPFPSINPLLLLHLFLPNLSFNLLPLFHPLHLQLLTILLILTFFLNFSFQHIQSNTLFQFIGFNGYGPFEAILLVEILN